MADSIQIPHKTMSLAVICEVLSVECIHEAFTVQLTHYDRRGGTHTLFKGDGHLGTGPKSYGTFSAVLPCSTSIKISVVQRGSTKETGSVSFSLGHLIVSGGLLSRHLCTSSRDNVGKVKIKVDIDEKQYSQPAYYETGIPALDRIRTTILKLLPRFGHHNTAAARCCQIFLNAIWEYLEQITRPPAQGNFRELYDNAPDDLAAQIYLQAQFICEAFKLVQPDSIEELKLEDLTRLLLDELARSSMLVFEWTYGYFGWNYATVFGSDGKSLVEAFASCQAALLRIRVRVMTLWNPAGIREDITNDIETLIRFAIKEAAREAQSQTPDPPSLRTLQFTSFLCCLRGKYAELVFLICDKEEFIHSPEETTIEKRAALRRLMARLAQTANALPKLYEVNEEHLAEETASAGSTNQGGYANVIRGTYRGPLNRGVKTISVAVKQLKYRPGHGNKQTFLEIINMITVNHPNVLSLLGYQRRNRLGTMSLITIWAKNGACTEFMRSQLDMPEQHRDSPLLLTRLSRRWILEVANGLDYLHQEGIIHGDLRGVNIVLDGRKHARIADFGLSVYVDAINGEFSSTRSGNEAWLASELRYVEGQGVGRPTMAGDVFSFAMACIEMYTGNNPWWPDHNPKLLTADKRPGRPKEPGSSEEMESALWNTVTQCWHQEAQARPTARNLLLQLKQIIPSSVLDGSPPVASPSVKRF